MEDAVSLSGLDVILGSRKEEEKEHQMGESPTLGYNLSRVNVSNRLTAIPTIIEWR